MSFIMTALGIVTSFLSSIREIVSKLIGSIKRLELDFVTIHLVLESREDSDQDKGER